ncbi:MAG: sigma-E processing peptidase SpoIIGA [Lachnospiraceae bacterium]|nr:sigma-E processing peptidase SpoIIGA [Lachnospiraceae bacterium]
MYYEVYVDILFAENLWMDTALLLLTAGFLHLRVRKRRVALAALLGSLGACALTVFSVYINGIGYLTGTLALCAVMTVIAFRKSGKFCGTFLTLYLESFLLNGLLRYLAQFHPLCGLWLAIVGIVACLLLYAAQRQLNRQKRLAALNCEATLICGNCRLTVEGFYDTGNGLCDPISGRPVSILAPELLEKLLAGAGRELPPRMIPYRTITQRGVLKAWILDGLEIRDADGIRIVRKPVVACMRRNRDSHPLILHRDLLPP